MSKATVAVEGVSKKFGLSLRSALRYGLADSFQRLVGRSGEPQLRSGEFWALQDIDFSLEPGDALGIMGINGSGKTTLLRILNGTYRPDAGKVMLKGRVGALIAAGAGFSPMLSGRENVYISGTLLGMTPTEISRRFDEIADFAELADFIDMPVRNYSSGMSVRLGFAVAVLGSPDILLVDEVLAVGDLRFQKKCFDRIQQLRRAGTTILFVSHAPGAVWSICNKGLLIDRGRSEGIVSVEDACRAYDHANMRARVLTKPSTAAAEEELPSEYGGARGGTGDVLVTSMEVLDGSGRVTSEVRFGETLILRLHLDLTKDIEDLIIRVQVDAEVNKAIAIIDSYEAHGQFYKLAAGKHAVDIEIVKPNLRPGVYQLSPSITRRDVGVHLFFQYDMAAVAIIHPADKFLYADFRASAHLESLFTVD
jgi:lipopolysaccharide transport system ATP-binding protein